MDTVTVGHLKTWMRNYLPLILTLGLFVGFGLHHLTKFVTADEHYWLYERIPQYWDALADEKWKKTLINDKPGVSVALISGAGLFFEPNPEEHTIVNNRKLDMYQVGRTEHLYAAFRIPILIFNLLVITYLFWIILKLTGNYWTTLWTTTGITLSPTLIGISQIVNPDALFWSSGAAAIFTYFTALARPKEKLWPLLTAVWFGFSLLSKYSATILFPSFTLFLLWRTFLYSGKNSYENSRQFAVSIRQHLYNYLIVCLGAITLFSVLVPAVFIKPEKLIEFLTGFSSVAPAMYASIIIITVGLLIATCWKKCVPLLSTVARFGNRFYPRLERLIVATALVAFLALIIGRNAIPDWTLFEKIPFDVKNTFSFNDLGYTPGIAEIFLLNFNPLAFSIIPIILVLMLAEWLRILFHKTGIEPREKNFLTVALTAFIFIFLTANAVSGTVTTIRYSILLYPLICFIAARGLVSVTGYFIARLHAKIIISFLFIGILSTSAFLSSPFYFNYTSALLPREKSITDAWGYGGYEAAQYINSLPDAENLTIWSDYYGVCEFIRGHCITSYNYETGEYPIDYYVLTRRGRIRYGPERDDRRRITTTRPYEYYDRDDPVWRLDINGRPSNSISVFRADDEASRACDGPRNLCVGIVTDIAACENDPGSYEYRSPRLSDMVKSLNHERTFFNVSLGDNANYGLRHCNESGERDLEWVKGQLDTKAPFHYVLGDHDIMSDTSTDAFWRTFTGQKQTYYSFDTKDVHVVILDTVLGGDRMRESCNDDPVCSDYQRSKDTLSSLLKNPVALQNHLVKNDLTRMDVIIQRNEYSRLFEEENQKIKDVRSPDRRDRGRIGANQLAWLEEDLRSTDKTKVLILSGHPLFRFQSPKKLYDIEDRESVQKILKESRKDVVSIAGEAHIWHDETIDGIHYYIVDELIHGEGTWAVFRWGESGHELIRFADGKKE